MKLLIQLPHCYLCDTIEGVRKCSMCDKFVCWECRGGPQGGMDDPDAYLCTHTKFVPIPNTGWYKTVEDTV